MRVEIALTDGTKIVVRDANIKEDDVLRKLENNRGIGGFVTFDTEHGAYRVNPAHVVYVRYA
ncbi:MAG TPA: hypothetical protein VE985_00715 [Gaiellaceae bacterium]|nr:hypothetical protein [Gaiellaceae bacterium]